MKYTLAKPKNKQTKLKLQNKTGDEKKNGKQPAEPAADIAVIDDIFKSAKQKKKIQKQAAILKEDSK
jgi:hypothetical protein